MPTYGYHCDSCGTDFDVWQSMSDEPKADCPSCSASARRLFYPAGIVFKGSGFHKTDYRKPGSSSGSSGSGSGSGASDGASKPSSDSKSGDSSSTTKATPKD